MVEHQWLMLRLSSISPHSVKQFFTPVMHLFNSVLSNVLELLRASCLTLDIKEFKCNEAKIEEGEKAGSRQESNPGHLWLESPVLCH